MEPHDSQKRSHEGSLKNLSTEELLERLRQANLEPSKDHPNKQTLIEFVNEQIEKEARANDDGNDPPSDRE